MVEILKAREKTTGIFIQQTEVVYIQGTQAKKRKRS